jgi:hypothetical protein
MLDLRGSGITTRLLRTMRAPGAGFLWLKERTASIWTAVLVHNLANVGGQFVNSLPLGR